MKNYNSSKNMMAEDLFSKELIQVFDKKTGEWIATIKAGEGFNFKELEKTTELKKENKNQLKLF